jgi:pimeloyl-ACP methyl ester carboxylesterase
MVKIRFRNREGLKLVGILEKPASKTRTCIILCHGGFVDKDEGGAFVALSKKLVKFGFAVFRFDFRAHGESQGNTMDLTFSGEARDIEAARSLLITKGYKMFGVVSASLSGGAMPLFIPKHQKDVKALVLWNSALDMKQVCRRWLSDGQAALLKRDGFINRKGSMVGKEFFREALTINPIRTLKRVRIPMLMIYGDKDSKMPHVGVARQARQLKTVLVTIRGAKHGFHGKRYQEQAISAALAFFLQNLPA